MATDEPAPALDIDLLKEIGKKTLVDALNSVDYVYFSVKLPFNYVLARLTAQRLWSWMLR